MALCGFDLGLGTGRFPELELTHLIPAQRLTVEYLEGINAGFGYANVVTDAIYGAEHFPGKMQSGALRVLLLKILMFVTGRPRAERRIRLAWEKGRARAYHELRQTGYFDKRK